MSEQETKQKKSRRIRWALIILLLIIVTAGVLLPKYIESKKAKAARIEQVQETEMQLESAFARYFSQVDREDPAEQNLDHYSVTGRLLDEFDTYMTAKVDKEGVVSALVYHMLMDQSLSADENLVRFNEYIGEMSSVFETAGVDTGEYRLSSVEQVPQDMGTEYLACPTDEEAYIDRNIDNMSVSLLYKAAESSDSSPTYYYFTVEREE